MLKCINWKNRFKKKEEMEVRKDKRKKAKERDKTRRKVMGC